MTRSLFPVLLFPVQVHAQSDCMDLADVDFGLCDMAMGVALVEGQCVSVSGCGYEVDGVDYSPYFYTSIYDCIACDESPCVDSVYIDPNVGCFSIWDPVCGCDGVTYSNECVALFAGGVTTWWAGACGDCIDPSLADPLVDCSPFDPEPVCGCDEVTHFSPCVATYMDWVTTTEPGACAGDCVDSTRIALDFGCPEYEETICGCDGVTYSNPCFAWYYGGVADWTSGPCEGASGIAGGEISALKVYPNPTSGALTLRLGGADRGLPWVLRNAAGQAVVQGTGDRVQLPVGMPKGLHLLEVQGHAPLRVVID